MQRRERQLRGSPEKGWGKGDGCKVISPSSALGLSCNGYRYDASSAPGGVLQGAMAHEQALASFTPDETLDISILFY